MNAKVDEISVVFLNLGKETIDWGGIRELLNRSKQHNQDKTISGGSSKEDSTQSATQSTQRVWQSMRVNHTIKNHLEQQKTKEKDRSKDQDI
jgi:hypothetical protein